MKKPRLLDMYCCAGGAGMGYHRAGFEVVGVDIEPQPHYPFEFHQGDAIQYLLDHWREFDAFHASPPCQEYSVTASLKTRQYPKLIEPTRNALQKTGKPYVMENVPGAPLLNPLMLCGTMFGLRVIRHRLFETSPAIWFPPATCSCKNIYTASHRGISSFDNGARAITVVGNNFKVHDGRIAMAIDWMNGNELAEAIPPAYTEFIGRHLILEVDIKS